MASCQPDCRLYCLVPDLDTARAIARDLSQACSEAPRLRVVVRRETLVVGLPEASVRERSGIVEAAKRGLFMGSIGGAITGLVAAIELPVTTLLACGLVVFGTVVGSLFGAWVCAMMGIEEPHSTIRPYQDAIEAGQVLIIANVDRDQVEHLEELIKRHHPAAGFSTSNDRTLPP